MKSNWLNLLQHFGMKFLLPETPAGLKDCRKSRKDEATISPSFSFFFFFFFSTFWSEARICPEGWNHIIFFYTKHFKGEFWLYTIWILYLCKKTGLCDFQILFKICVQLNAEDISWLINFLCLFFVNMSCNMPCKNNHSIPTFLESGCIISAKCKNWSSVEFGPSFFIMPLPAPGL